MNGWVVAGIVAVILVPPLVLFWSILRVASDADDAMEWEDVEVDWEQFWAWDDMQSEER